MFGKRCQLCGGKLDHNICTLCGLDNSKSDKNYKLNQSSCDDETLTHVHEEAKTRSSARVSQRQDKRQTQPREVQPRAQRSAGRRGGKNSAAGKVIAIITVLGILFNLVQIGFESFDVFDSFNGFGEGSMEEELYSNVTYELSEEGEQWSQSLVQGEYVVGVHIPEGTYTITFGGEPNLEIEDDVNSIYLWEDSFDPEGGLKEVEDIRCYEGAKLKIFGNGWVDFYSENAQVDAMTGSENPLTESVVVKNGNVAGVDFPAGTYDITMEKGEADFRYIVPGTVIDNQEDDYVETTNSMWISAYDSEPVYRNVYLPEGTEILIDGDDVTLVPSEVILPDYEGYYYIYE